MNRREKNRTVGEAINEIKEIKDRWPNSYDHILRILLRKNARDGWVGYLKIGPADRPADHIVAVDEDEKIRREITKWIDAISHPDEMKLEHLSNAMFELHKNNNERALTRSLRMLLFLESLLVGIEGGDHSEWAKLEMHTKKILRGNRPLIDAIKLLKDLHFQIDEKYSISMALLLVTAVAMSQCESFRPVFWEGYSAARARNELEKNWEGLRKDKILSMVLDIVTLIIRFQSEPGQYSRKTGNEKFRENMSEVLKRYDNVLKKTKTINGRVSSEKLRDSICVIIAVVEEARNHRMPLDIKVGKWDLNSGISFDWEPEETQKLSTAIMERGRGARHLWAFASRLGFKKTDLPVLDEFKRFVEENVEALTRKKIEIEKVIQFSFGRQQIHDLRNLLRDHIKKVVDAVPESGADAVDQLTAFKNSFEVRVIPVPSCFQEGRNEIVVKILLYDYIAATALLFGEPIHTEAPGNTAADLLAYLYKGAKSVFKLEFGLVHDKQKFYLPFPLFDRMLAVVYRLRPESCMSIPLTFDDEHEKRILLHIPAGLNKNNTVHVELIDCITNYVHAYVLNRGMSKGFHSCDIGLYNITEDGNDPNSLTADEWFDKLCKSCQSNAYNVLLQEYLSFYNTERENVQHLYISRPSTLQTTPINQIRNELAVYYDGHVKKQFFFLGIDIGGTLTKFQFYRFKAEKKERIFQRIGDPFRMLTRMSESDGKDREDTKPQDKSKEFARRLINTIRNNITLNLDEEYKSALKKNSVLAIGVSWPGAVRENRIAGPSGVLRQFFPKVKVIHKVKIQDIWELDILQQFEDLWHETGIVDEKPTVALVNDGNADGIGTVVNLTRGEMQQESIKGRLAVIKLGTGTAGAVFVDGRLDAALNEWGKMLLDLAAHPNLRNSDPIPYPAGVANQYLSKKTMPTLAKYYLFEDEKKLFKAPRDLDSQELGLLLETRENAESELKIDSLKILREECGIRRFSSQGLTQEIDAEVFRRVWKALQKDKRPETELFRLLQARLRESSLSGLKKKLEKEIRIQGELRLQTILDVQPGDDIRNLFQTKTISKAIDEVLREAYVACEMFAEALGNYLGDFIVQLYDIYKDEAEKLSTVILGGGVLSGKTRELVISQAQKRTDMYNIWLAEEDEKWRPKKYRNRKEPHNIKITIKYPGTDSQGKKPDFGTLGAAAYAAGEFLFNLKKEGLNRIKKNLMRLEPGQSIRVLEGSAVFRALSDEIILKEFALEERDVIDYLDKHGAEHNYLSAGTDSEGAKVYTRWIRE